MDPLNKYLLKLQAYTFNLYVKIAAFEIRLMIHQGPSLSLFLQYHPSALKSIKILISAGCDCQSVQCNL